jgi:superfamily I DNA/RNA helicase
LSNYFEEFFLIEIVLSTAHKAKGLEFPIVILADDFLPRSSDSPLEQLSLDEHRENLNILYVATTRATKELILNMDLFYLLYKMCHVRKKNDVFIFVERGRYF